MESLAPAPYVQSIILKHLHVIQENIPGVRTNKSIEPLHRLRVATRRLRNALWIVRHVFPSEKLQEWTTQIRLFSRAAGEARDLDVFLEFLLNLEKKSKDPTDKQLLQEFIAEFRHKRDAVQPKLIRSLNVIRQHKTFEHIEEYLRHLPLWSQEENPDYLYTLTCQRIKRRLKKFLKYKKYASHPECGKELHEMRIAAKHLRYTLETFQPVLGRKTDRFIKTSADIQRLLGELHDYDVWIEIFKRHILSKRGNKALAGTHLVGRLNSLRDTTYQQFILHWRKCEKRDVWNDLRKFLSAYDSEAEYRIALVSDVHANWLALKAVLEHAKRKKADIIWNLGDLLGYCPFPNEVVQAFRKHKAVSIIGNYDLKVLQFPQNSRTWKKSKDPAKYFSFAWTYKNLKKENAAYLKQLPEQKALAVGEKKILFVHGSPRDIDDELAVDTPITVYRAIAKNVQEDVVLCGHTHQFFVKKAGRVTFINPGSVGRPFDGNPRASYALLKIYKDQIKVKNFRLKYNVRKTLKAMRKNDFPEELVQSIGQGRSVDELRPAKA